PPRGIAPAAMLRRNDKHLVGTRRSEGTVMTNVQPQGQPQGGPGANQGVAPHVFAALPQQYDAHAQPPAGGGWASADGAPGVVPTVVAPTAIATPPEAVRPQEASGGCSCGGAHPPQGMSPSQEEALAAQQQNVGRTQRLGAAAYHNGIPMQAAYGTQPALS